MRGRYAKLIYGGALVLIGVTSLAARPVVAQTVIRDAEIEATIDAIAQPIFDAAGLDRDVVRVQILSDDKLNAFVAGGQNLFLNTGLIIRTENVAQLTGVIAHETGHIAGGHLTRANEARGRATAETLLGALLGAAAAVAGAPQVGTAILAGGATVAQRGFLAFSRSQEQTADQAAVGFLAQEGQSPGGLLEFFRILQDQNLGISADGSEFLRTHPLTRDRISFLESKVAASPYRDQRNDPTLVEAHRRMVAKLDGFLGEPDEVLQRYRGDSTADLYARSVARYRNADTRGALRELDTLVAREPRNPYFRELEGQVLFETGKVAAAEEPYREALMLRPASSLLRVGLARALMEQNDPSKLGEARALLAESVRVEPRNPSGWRLLGIAEGQLGNKGAAALALAEEAVLQRRKDDARLQLRRAEQLIRPQDPQWVRLQDVQRSVDDMPDPRPGPRAPG